MNDIQLSAACRSICNADRSKISRVEYWIERLEEAKRAALPFSIQQAQRELRKFLDENDE